jgi:hypothetical protein
MLGEVVLPAAFGEAAPNAGDAVRAIVGTALPILGEAVDGMKGAAEGLVPPLLLPPTAGLAEGLMMGAPGRFDWL